jgi:serine/threonine protein kinase
MENATSHILVDGYKFVKTLGQGSYGKVELARHIYTKEKVGHF